MQGIEIPIGADLSQLKAAQKEIKDRLAQLANGAGAAGAGLGNSLAKGSNQAAFALQNLGRVAQDAPFGFIGIQNNLNPLLESFQQLKAQSGSTSGALKALGSSLIGPAGLGIALSVVSSAVLFYQQYQQKANKTTNDAKKAADDYVNTLGQLQQVQLKGATSAQEELTTLSLLFNQYKDQNSPLEKRKAAYEELQKLYPSYFKDLAFEATAAGNTKTAYDLLTQSILANARAEAAKSLITKNATRQLENDLKIINLTTESEKQRAIAAKALIAVKASGGELDEAKALADFTAALGKQTQIQSQINNLKTDSNLLTDKNLQLEKSITTEKSKIDPKFNDEIEKSNKSIKTQSDILKALDLDYKQIAADFSITFGKGNEERVTAVKKAINDLVGIGFNADSSIIKKLQTQLLAISPDEIKAQGKEVGVNAAVGISDGLAAVGPVIAKDLGNNLKIGLTDWQLYVNEQLLPKLQTNFQTFFDDILMRGKLSFDSLGKAILNTLLSVVASEAAAGLTNLLSFSSGKDFTDSKKGGKGGLLSGIAGLIGIGGKAAAAVGGTAAAGGGTAALATGTAATGGALLPILAGVAAVAGIASLFKKKQQAPLPQASSTISTTAAGSSQDFGGGRVIFEISGTNLIGVLNRAGAKLQRFGP